MRACAHGDARVRDLVAELLWFHQRSQKPGWWALFERQAWSEDELVDDAESLGGLQLDTHTPPVQVKRSLDTAYVFPPQDTKLKVGDTPRIAETLGYAGSIVELSAEDGRIVLRRGMKSGAMPERFSLVPAPINLQSVPDAVIAFADRFARGPTEADQALLDILMRRAPRLKGRAAGLPVRNPGEPLTDAVIRAVMDLDHSYLFIQGPPGTGKTYTAAQAIVALLRAGKRVGVSSNSHKAINKLLSEVEKRAAESRASVSAARRRATRTIPRPNSTASTSRRFSTRKTLRRSIGLSAARCFISAAKTNAGPMTICSSMKRDRYRSAISSPWRALPRTSFWSAIRCSCRSRCRACIRAKPACPALSISLRTRPPCRRIAAFF